MPDTPTARDVYRCSPSIRGALGASMELAYFPLRQVARLIPPADSRILRACQTFRTLEDHARQIQRELQPGVSAEEIEARLEFLAGQGGLISYREIVEGHQASAITETHGRVEYLAIPTADRPAEVERAVASYSAILRDSNRRRCLLVVDSSRDTATREAIQRYVSASGLTIRHTGREDHAEFAEALAGQGIDRDLIDFALFGAGFRGARYGSNRNLMLLYCAGSMLVSADDDTICEAMTAPGTSHARALRLRDSSDVTEFWCFSDRDAAIAAAEACPRDFVGAHEEVVGLPLGRLIRRAESEGDVDVDSMPANLIRSLCAGAAQVRVTYNGVVGDAGMHSSHDLPIHPGRQTRERLLISPASYRTALTSREVIRQATATTVCQGGTSMGMFLGLDMRELLPPFMPLYRSEDGVFGAILAHCDRDACVAHLPFSLPHLPARQRQYAGGDARIRVCDAVLALVASWDREGRPARAAERLGSLGRFLIEIGSLDLAEFDQVLRTVVWTRTAESVRRHEALLRQNGGAPTFWRTDISCRIQQLQQAAVKPDYIYPADLCEHYRPEDVLAVLKSFIAQYGRLLVGWPSLVDAARGLRRSDRQQRRRAVINA